jgi:chromosome segregation protein
LEDMELHQSTSNPDDSAKPSLIRFRKLVLQGFKSFPDHTELLFDDNVCAIVGPNGCGKSNILDALRWVLGEQGPTQLRARTMSDVVFNGAAGRKPLGMAEITLVIESSPGSLPLSYQDIAITRRLYRNGDSEYLLNRASCRLKDITDLFLDTGIGRGAYSLIEQGRVDALVTSRPDERRGFLEQIAGIEKYKVRKKEALSRLITTENNLARVRDVISEVKSRRVSLARQARKAAKFRSLKMEMNTLQRLLAGGRCAKLRAGLKSVADNTARIENAMARNSARHALLSVALGESSKHTAIAQTKLKKTAEEFAQIETRIDTIESRLNDIDSRRSERDADIIRETDEAEKLEGQCKSLKNRNHHLDNEMANLKTQHETLERNIAVLETEYQNIESVVQKTRLQLADARSRRLRDVAERSELQHRIVSSENRLNDLKKRLVNLHTEGDLLHTEEHSIQKKHDALQVKIHALETEHSELTSRTDAMKNRRADVIEQQESAVLNQRNIEKERLSLVSRMESLADIVAAGEGLDNGVRQTLKQFDRYRHGNNMIFGTIADLYDTPDEYEEAAAAGLYPHLQDIIVAEPSVSDEMCLYLIKEKPGRTTIRQIPDRHRPCSEDVRNKPGLPPEIKPLREVITSAPEFKPLFDALLCNVFLAPDTEIAETTANAFPDAVVVTPCGLRWGSGKARTIGRTVDNRPAYRRRKKEIRELRLRISDCQERESKANSDCDELDGLRRQIEHDWAVLQESAAVCNQKIAVARGEFDHLRRHLQQIKTRHETVTEETGLLKTEQDVLTQQLHQNRILFSKIKELPGSNTDIETLETRIQTIESDRDRSREKLTEQRIQLRSSVDRSEFVKREKSRLNDETDRLIHLIDQHRSQAEKIRELLAADNRKRTGLTRELQGHIETCPVFRNRIDTLKTQFEQAQQAHQELADDMAEVEKNDRNLERDIADIRVRKASLETALSALKDDSFCNPEEEADELGRIPDEQEMDDWKNQLETLQDTLSMFTDVNLGAEQEHGELVERNRFLEEQLQDMEHAIQSLRSTIQQINRTSKSRFLDALTAVNQHFGSIFQGLFGGGEASLKLTDPDDPIESGVDIVCKPPGKRARTIDLLSGGEKALAALALLLAGFKYRPSPLLFLDEVDAPLDENNVTRFTTFLKKLSEITQVVMITHNPLTMEAADILYGVTMEEPGISKLVSARLGIFST